MEHGGTLARAVLPGLRQEDYAQHALHAADRIWPEKNCYIDIWLEVTHALGLLPEAMLGFTLCVDFEGDQFTFFKPSHDEIRALYGIEVQELTVWRPLIEHVEECLAAGKLVSTESDSFWLPDTAATDYRRAHGKTTIVINALDRAGQRMGYWHNAGYYELAGEDFVKTFRLDAGEDPTFLPLFAEFIRLDRVVRRSPEELRRLALALLRKHLEHRPVNNPVARFAARFSGELPLLQEAGLAYYHKWAFGSIRQLGAAMELTAAHARWLAGDDAEGSAAGSGADAHPRLASIGADDAAAACERISQGCKTLILKCARAVNSRKPADFSELLGAMAGDWDAAMAALERVAASEG